MGIKLGEKLTIAKLVGKGRLGDVFAGVHPVLARRFAIRVFRPPLVQEARVKQRLRHMVREASTVEHHNVVSLVDFGQLPDGRCYLTSDYVRGVPLTKVLTQVNRLPVPRALGLLIQLAEALGAAHRARVVHGDIKPNNIIMVERQDQTQHLWLTDIKLTQAVAPDFDSARPLRHLTVHSTPDYLAPELIKGRRLDERVDVYAFGALAYRLLTGEPPFVGTPKEVVLAHRTREPVPPSRRVGAAGIPQDLDAVILRCLQKHPSDRFESTEPVAHMLRTILGGVEVARREVRDMSTIQIPRMPEQEEPLPESPARLRQLFFDSIQALAHYCVAHGQGSEELEAELAALSQVSQEAHSVASQGESTENRFEDVRQQLRERESTLRYAIIDLNLTRTDLQTPGGEQRSMADVEFQITELERSLGALEQQRVKQFATLKDELNKRRERYKVLERQTIVHLRRLYALLDDLRPDQQDPEAQRMYRMIERCRNAVVETQKRGR